MSVPVIQADYEQLEHIALTFEGEYQRMQDVSHQVAQRVSALRSGGWHSDAAEQFYRDFDGDLAPALRRLASALQHASKTTREISRIVKQAEEEAAAQLGGEAQNSDGFMLARQSGGEGDGRAEALTERFREQLREGDGGATPVMAGVAGALPLAGGAALADGPLPIGDIIALGILGAALIGTILMASSSDEAASNPNVDEEKVGRVLGESETATGNVTSGETLNDDEALDALGEWVGDDVEEVAPGVFRSRTPNADGTYNQGRIDDSSLEGSHAPDVPHIHLERVRPDPARPGRWENVSNNHIPLE